MFDMLLRMVDTQGKEILPSEFMPAAERNDLLVADRSLGDPRRGTRFARARSPVACSCGCREASAIDTSLLAWLDEQLRQDQARAEPDLHPDHRGHCRPSSEDRSAAGQRPAEPGPAVRTGAFRRRARPAAPAGIAAAGFREDRWFADAGTGGRCRCSSPRCAHLSEAAHEQGDRDHRRARRGRQHHGGAVAAGRAASSRAS